MRTVIGVMGSGRPLDGAAFSLAHKLGALIAERGWVLLTGGRSAGVMDAASRGAKGAGGLVIGVLPDADGSLGSEYLDVAIRTGMGDARNVINVLSSDVVIALPGGAGTVSEVALALKAGKAVIVLGWEPGEALRASGPGRIFDAADADDALAIAASHLGSHDGPQW
ncbi:MAG: TIGR00725 family protein [Coriobacteriia bacterium]|nr:TIGR00725 family protein [Coriobacteriia bacterium]